MSSPANKPPTWFWVVCIIGLIWNLMGVASFFMHITISEETLSAMPENERALYTNFPIWVTITFAVAVFGSLIGSILLLIRKRLATPVLVVSFIAILFQMTYSIFLSDTIKVHGPAALGLPTLVIIFGALLLWVSRKADTNGWTA